jgi:hypothetical protein
MKKPEPDDSDSPESRRAALIGLVVALALAAGGFFLVKALHDSAQMQDCVMSGRTNCAPIDTSSESHASN